MNSYKRVMNTLSGEAVDRLPVFAVMGAYGAKLTGVDLRTLYSDANAYVAGQQALQTEFGFDLVLSAFDFSAISEAFGGKTAWSVGQAPNMKRPAARTAAEALLLPLPDPQRTARLPVVLDATRQLAGLYEKQVPIISVLPGPGILPSLIVGIEQWMEAVLFDQLLAQELLNHTTRFFVSWASALLEAGADCLVVAEGMASAEIAQRSLFAEQILPHLTAAFASIEGPKVLHHAGGRINHTLDLLVGLNGLVGVTVGSKDNLSEARRLIGPNLTLIGNLDNLTLPSVTEEEVYEMSLACLREGASSGRFILANSAADIPLATPVDNLRAMIAASASYSSGINRKRPSVIWLCCGVLRAEMEALHRQGVISGEMIFLDSMLHMDPAILEAKLIAALEQNTNRTGRLVLVYGDCSPKMLNLERRFQVGRVDAVNCAQLLVGHDRYRQLMRENAFMILPEWAGRWEHIMKCELGLTREVAHDLMCENRGELVYLDTGLTPVPEKELGEFSAYSGLPFRVETVSLNLMLAALLKARDGAQTSPACEESR